MQTPGVGTIAALAEFLGIDERLTAKAVIVVPEDEQGGVVLALVRGDHRLHELKLAKALGAPHPPGAAGRDPRRRSAPTRARSAPSASPTARCARSWSTRPSPRAAYVVGANRTDWHLRNVEHGRDFAARVADIRHVEDGRHRASTAAARCASSR